MMRFIPAVVLVVLFPCMLFAQNDAQPVKKEPAFDQYFGVQINDLVRQVLNFSNTTTTGTVNPYILNYSINSKATGIGMRAGLGYNYTSTSSDDGINNTVTKLNDLSFRIGIDKIIKISQKWVAGYGLDVVLNINDDHTTDNVNSSFGGQSTDTKTNITTYGMGPMAWLRYHLTNRILVGTEASFYYITGNQKQTTNVFDPNNPGFSVPTTTSDNIGQGTISDPVVLYLVIKF